MTPHRRTQHNLRLAALIPIAAIGLSILPSCADPELAAQLQLLERGALFAPDPIRFHGIRRVRMIDGSRTLSHLEEIAVFSSDDIGARLTEVNGADPKDVEHLLFFKDARRNFRYRDVAFDSIDRVRANYDVARVPGDPVIAGRPTFQLVFRRTREAGGSVEIWGDKETGVVLSVVRKGLDGKLLYSMVFEKIEYGRRERTPGDPPKLPVVPQATPSKVPFDALDIGNAIDGTDLDGFAGPVRQFNEVSVGDQVFQACTDRFSDGLQHVFVVQGNPARDFWIVPPPEAPEAQTTLYSASVASMNIVWTRVAGRSLAAYGPFSERALGGLLQSYRAAR